MNKLIPLALLLALLLGLPALAESVPAQDADTEALRAQAEAAGLALPVPGEGEKLYLGNAHAPGTWKTQLYLALLLSPNGCSFRYATLFGEALQVPQPQGDPHLINHQTRTVEDMWIPLDMTGDTTVLLDENGLGIYGLGFEDGFGHCRMVLAGRCETPRDPVNGDYSAEAELTLYNLTGDTAREAVNPPTAQDAEAAGMKLPEIGAGETLYLGAANVSQAEALYVAFALSRDGTELKGLTVFAHNLAIEYRLGNKKVSTTSSGYGTTVNNPLKAEEAIEAGAIRLSGYALPDDGAEAVLRYAYHANDDDLDYPLDPAEVKFMRVEN